MAEFIQLPGGALGANIEQMTQLVNFLRQAIEQLENVFKGIDNKVSATTWSGNDARTQASNWNQTRQSTMNNLRSLLDQLGTAIQNQARQQQDTSSS